METDCLTEIETSQNELGGPPLPDVHRMVISGELSGHRLDFAVSRELGISRAYAQRLIKNGRVFALNGRRIKPSARVEPPEEYSIDVPRPEKLDLEPEDIPFEVVYSDDDLIVVDKPAGLVVHPAPGHWRGTLVHGLLFRFPELGNLNGVERPGIVHRLDATTSGLMVVARNGLAQEGLFRGFKERRIGKAYLALCHGEPRRPVGRLEMPIGRDPINRHRMAVVEDGRDAVTDYKTLWSRFGYSLVRCELHSGRTHQIRVHMRAADCPLVGDELYAPSKKSPFARPRVFLHSWRLSFAHPRSGDAMTFRSFLPADLRNLLQTIRAS
ncbi:MAG: RluA family pseudouridine synthase [Synergistaceae bacterium]|jgi:23S rRNA pseudouridine1911/1915/1917 synthase|nr:RluA family pseudouridine synthase [Synergistaceae bacterium]